MDLPKQVLAITASRIAIKSPNAPKKLAKNIWAVRVTAGNNATCFAMMLGNQ